MKEAARQRCEPFRNKRTPTALPHAAGLPLRPSTDWCPIYQPSSQSRAGRTTVLRLRADGTSKHGRRRPPRVERRERAGFAEVEGGDCNPFVLVKCGGEAEQTHVVNSSQNPEWTTQRMIFLDVAENGVDHVVLSVWHKNLGGGSDVPLGQAIVYLRTVVLSPGIEQDDRIELTPVPGQTNECSGSLR